MVSRTPEGKHTKRFIVEVKTESNDKYYRSGNQVINGFFATREEAQTALEAHGSEGLKYRVRQK
jgi:hypothetical protein